jgi:hypothetical protein
VTRHNRQLYPHSIRRHVFLTTPSNTPTCTVAGRSSFSLVSPRPLSFCAASVLRGCSFCRLSASAPRARPDRKKHPHTHLAFGFGEKHTRIGAHRKPSAVRSPVRLHYTHICCLLTVSLIRNTSACTLAVHHLSLSNHCRHFLVSSSQPYTLLMPPRMPSDCPRSQSLGGHLTKNKRQRLRCERSTKGSAGDDFTASRRARARTLFSSSNLSSCHHHCFFLAPGLHRTRQMPRIFRRPGRMDV